MEGEEEVGKAGIMATVSLLCLKGRAGAVQSLTTE